MRIFKSKNGLIRIPFGQSVPTQEELEKEGTQEIHLFQSALTRVQGIDYKTIHENKILINPLSPQERLDKFDTLLNIMSLDRYSCESCQSFAGIYADMTEDEEGKYVRLEDVLALFSPKKQ